MAKFCGAIGFVETVETAPGVWEEHTIQHIYFGDLIKNTRRLQQSGELNDNITISNEISIIADPYANENFHSIRYAVFMGVKWKVVNVEVQYPRLILSLGGIYNGK